MGLDVVEFIMDVEEAFGVSIPDEVASSIRTPRHLMDYVQSHLSQSSEDRCLSQRAFYAIRRGMKQRFDVARSAIRPDTELQNLLPRENPREAWSDVGQSLGVSRWPKVRGKGWLGRIFRGSGPRTVGEAARDVAIHSPNSIKPPEEGWSRNEVATVLDGLLRSNFGIDKYSLDDRFVEDLRLD